MKLLFLLIVSLFLSTPLYSSQLPEIQLSENLDSKPTGVPLGDPFILLWEGKYYAYGTQSPDGIAVYVKYDNNPVFQKPGNLVGIGHSALFTDKEGKLRIVFHAHYSTSQIHPRQMYISTVNFITVNGKAVMEIDKNYITPILSK